jgi:hypothetical protein
MFYGKRLKMAELSIAYMQKRMNALDGDNDDTFVEQAFKSITTAMIHAGVIKLTEFGEVKIDHAACNALKGIIADRLKSDAVIEANVSEYRESLKSGLPLSNG